MKTNLKIPDDFTCEVKSKTRLELRYKSEGYVTVDFASRAWVLGIQGSVYRRSRVPEYFGRGWKQKMVDDATAYLRGIYE